MAVKVAFNLRSRQKCDFGLPIFRGRVYPRFRTYIFKSHSLPSMWPVIVGSVQRTRRVADDKKKKKIAVKPKSADDYIRRPNYYYYYYYYY